MGIKRGGASGCIWVIVVVVVFSMMSLFSGIDSQSKEDYLNAKQFLANTRRKIKIKKEKFMQEINSSESLKRYYKSENWDKEIQEIEKNLIDTKNYMTRKLDPLLKKDRSEFSSTLRRAAGSTLKKCRQQIRKFDAIEKLKEEFKTLISELPSRLAKYTENLKKMKGLLMQSGPFYQSVKDAVGNYPGKKGDIGRGWSEIKKLFKDAVVLYRIFKGESSKSRPDYSSLYYTEKDLLKTTDIFYKKYSKLAKAIDELNTVWDRILIDMKHREMYKVHYKTYDDYDRVVRSETKTVTERVFRNTYTDQVVSRGYYETWVDSKWRDYMFYHKYRDVKNKKAETSDWIFVKNSFFQKHLQNLGMVILSKPRGLYNYEAVKHTAPPGYYYLNNKSFGHWVERNGKKVWEYEPEYDEHIEALYEEEIPEIDYAEYNVYRRHRGTYYGRGGRIRWGTRGRWTRKRFGRSRFFKRGGRKTYSSGKFRNRGRGFGK